MGTCSFRFVSRFSYHGQFSYHGHLSYISFYFISHYLSYIFLYIGHPDEEEYWELHLYSRCGQLFPIRTMHVTI
jgi:nitroreductase